MLVKSKNQLRVGLYQVIFMRKRFAIILKNEIGVTFLRVSAVKTLLKRQKFGLSIVIT